MARRHWLVGGAVLLLVLALPATRDAVLLQTTAGGYVPLFLFTLFTVGPAAVAGLNRTRLRRWIPRGFQGAARLSRESVLWAGLFAILLAETLIDPLWTSWLGWDFSGAMLAVEDAWVARIQDSLRPGALGPWLDWTFAYLYAYGYLLLFGGLMAAALFRGDRELSRTLLRTYAVVWAVGIASYLFVPINEPWAVDGEVENVLHDLVPPSRTNPFVAAHVNNEFPSLHAAVCVAAGAVLWRLNRRRALAWASPVVLGIPLAIVYLGIHWISDSVAGVALGLAAAQIGPHVPLWRRKAEGFAAPPSEEEGPAPKTEIDPPSSPPPSSPRNQGE